MIMRVPRSRSFAFVGCMSTIRLPRTRPSLIITAVATRESTLVDLSDEALRTLGSEVLGDIQRLTEVAYDDRSEKGLYITRTMKHPVGARDVKKLLGDPDVAVSFDCGAPQPDGTVVVDIFSYPESEYPELYALKRLNAAIAKETQARKVESGH